VKAVLHAVLHDAEVAVEDVPVRIDPEPDLEDEVAVPVESVEPVAVVEVAIARTGLVDRLRGLVNHEVVEVGNHERTPMSEGRNETAASSAASLQVTRATCA
jgi:hypothetical protein